MLVQERLVLESGLGFFWLLVGVQTLLFADGLLHVHCKGPVSFAIEDQDVQELFVLSDLVGSHWEAVVGLGDFSLVAGLMRELE